MCEEGPHREGVVRGGTYPSKGKMYQLSYRPYREARFAAEPRMGHQERDASWPSTEPGWRCGAGQTEGACTEERWREKEQEENRSCGWRSNPLKT